jgi:hypothetical protein
MILSGAEIVNGKGIDYPHPSNVTFKRAPKAEIPLPEQLVFAAEEAPPARAKRKKPEKR